MRRPALRLEEVKAVRILTVSDEESSFYYDHYVPGRLEGFDLILSCGDLRREYLEFLGTLARCPVVYVRGNHDDRLEKHPPEGCLCAEDRIVVCGGLRILGLGGSLRYRSGGNMYTEEQMRRRIARLRLQLWRHRGFDILLTHAPARHIHDLESLPHRGFQCFVDLLDRYSPTYFIHGHVHLNYGAGLPRRTQRGNTAIINAYRHYILEIPD